MPIRLARVEEAVGRVLAHDVSIVTPDRKGAMLRRGHIISSEDVPALKAAGHDLVYVADRPEELGRSWGDGLVFEDSAVTEVAEELAGPNTEVASMAEGKAVVKASLDGLLKVRAEAIYEVNLGGHFAIVTKPHDSVVRAGEAVAIVDLIPLAVSEALLQGVKHLLSGFKPVVSVKPFKPFRAALIVAATEVYEGRIEDLATPVVKRKLCEYCGSLSSRAVVPDDERAIADAIRKAIKGGGVDAVLVVGGMSVDPTDRTPGAIKAVADDIVAYGIPYKPNTMAMVAYASGRPVLGVPSSIIYFRERNILDVLLPRIAARERIRRSWLASLGVGGLTEAFDRGLLSRGSSAT